MLRPADPSGRAQATAEEEAGQPTADDSTVEHEDSHEDSTVEHEDSTVEQGAPGAGLDLPLLSGNTELLSHWQRIQAEFVDDPQVAVSGAADLVEQAAQALVDALQQRQRQMRASWDRNGTSGPATTGDTAAGTPSDTEQLRQMMVRYRALFKQLCQPVQA